MYSLKVIWQRFPLGSRFFALCVCVCVCVCVCFPLMIGVVSSPVFPEEEVAVSTSHRQTHTRAHAERNSDRETQPLRFLIFTHFKGSRHNVQEYNLPALESCLCMCVCVCHLLARLFVVVPLVSSIEHCWCVLFVYHSSRAQLLVRLLVVVVVLL